VSQCKHCSPDHSCARQCRDRVTATVARDMTVTVTVPRRSMHATLSVPCKRFAPSQARRYASLSACGLLEVWKKSNWKQKRHNFSMHKEWNVAVTMHVHVLVHTSAIMHPFQTPAITSERGLLSYARCRAPACKQKSDSKHMSIKPATHSIDTT
jgi:hypothetical protein